VTTSECLRFAWERAMGAAVLLGQLQATLWTKKRDREIMKGEAKEGGRVEGKESFVDREDILTLSALARIICQLDASRHMLRASHSASIPYNPPSFNTNPAISGGSIRGPRDQILMPGRLDKAIGIGKNGKMAHVRETENKILASQEGERVLRVNEVVEVHKQSLHRILTRCIGLVEDAELHIVLSCILNPSTEAGEDEEGNRRADGECDKLTVALLTDVGFELVSLFIKRLLANEYFGGNEDYAKEVARNDVEHEHEGNEETCKTRDEEGNTRHGNTNKSSGQQSRFSLLSTFESFLTMQEVDPDLDYSSNSKTSEQSARSIITSLVGLTPLLTKHILALRRKVQTSYLSQLLSPSPCVGNSKSDHRATKELSGRHVQNPKKSEILDSGQKHHANGKVSAISSPDASKNAKKVLIQQVNKTQQQYLSVPPRLASVIPHLGSPIDREGTTLLLLEIYVMMEHEFAKLQAYHLGDVEEISNDPIALCMVEAFKKGKERESEREREDDENEEDDDISKSTSQKDIVLVYREIERQVVNTNDLTIAVAGLRVLATFTYASALSRRIAVVSWRLLRSIFPDYLLLPVHLLKLEDGGNTIPGMHPMWLPLARFMNEVPDYRLMIQELGASSIASSVKNILKAVFFSSVFNSSASSSSTSSNVSTTNFFTTPSASFSMPRVDQIEALAVLQTLRVFWITWWVHEEHFNRVIGVRSVLVEVFRYHKEEVNALPPSASSSQKSSKKRMGGGKKAVVSGKGGAMSSSNTGAGGSFKKMRLSKTLTSAPTGDQGNEDINNASDSDTSESDYDDESDNNLKAASSCNPKSAPLFPGMNHCNYQVRLLFNML